MPDSTFKKLYGNNPIYLAFHTIVMNSIKLTEVIDKYSPISIVIDDDRESSLQCYEMLHRLKQAFPVVRERIHGISFVNDRSYPGVQAADMIAYEVTRFMERKKKDNAVQASERLAALTLFGNHQPKLYTAALLDEMNATTVDEAETT